MPSFTAKVNNWYAHLPGIDISSASTLFFQSITSIQLHPEIGNDPDTSESLRNIYIYIGIAGLIILIASINYINLLWPFRLIKSALSRSGQSLEPVDLKFICIHSPNRYYSFSFHLPPLP